MKRCTSDVVYLLETLVVGDSLDEVVVEARLDLSEGRPVDGVGVTGEVGEGVGEFVVDCSCMDSVARLPETSKESKVRVPSAFAMMSVYWASCRSEMPHRGPSKLSWNWLHVVPESTSSGP